MHKVAAVERSLKVLVRVGAPTGKTSLIETFFRNLFASDIQEGMKISVLKMEINNMDYETRQIFATLKESLITNKCVPCPFLHKLF